MVQHALEDVVRVVEAPPKHDLADDVGHSVVQQRHGVKRLPCTQSISKTGTYVCVCARAPLPTSLPLHGLLQVTALLTDALLHGAFGQAKRA